MAINVVATKTVFRLKRCQRRLFIRLIELDEDICVAQQNGTLCDAKSWCQFIQRQSRAEQPCTLRQFYPSESLELPLHRPALG